MLVLMMVLGGVTLQILNTEKTLLDEQVSAFGKAITRQFADSATEPVFTDDQTTLEVLTRNLVISDQVSYAVIKDRTGETLAEAGKMQAFTFSLGKVFSAEVEFKGVTAGEVEVHFSGVALSESIEATVKTVLLLLLIMLFITFAVAAFLSRRISKPVIELVKATEQIGQGDYDISLHHPYHDEVGQMAQALSRMASQLREKQQLEGLFSRVVADDVAKTLMSDLDTPELATVQVDASVLFVDIVGFTSLSENRSSSQVVKLLNEYFNYFTQCSNLFFGSVDKFIGDCAMIVFGLPGSNGDHRYNSIACAVTIQRLLNRIRNECESEGSEPPVHVKIGINSGVMMAGTIGAEKRMEYTVIGDTVNVASRLSDKAAADDILVGEDTFKLDELKGRVKGHAVDKLAVKGKKEPITAYRVDDVSVEKLRTIDALINDLLEHR